MESGVTDHFKCRLTVPRFWRGHLCLCAQTPAGSGEQTTENPGNRQQLQPGSNYSSSFFNILLCWSVQWHYQSRTIKVCTRKLVLTWHKYISVPAVRRLNARGGTLLSPLLTLMCQRDRQAVRSWSQTCDQVTEICNLGGKNKKKVWSMGTYRCPSNSLFVTTLKTVGGWGGQK